MWEVLLDDTKLMDLEQEKTAFLKFKERKDQEQRMRDAGMSDADISNAYRHPDKLRMFRNITRGLENTLSAGETLDKAEKGGDVKPSQFVNSFNKILDTGIMARNAGRAKHNRAKKALRAHLAQQGQTKEAGLFMKPSDIADHTNLARELENKLNGQAPADDPMFKKAGAASKAVGATIGAIAGGYAAHKQKNKKQKELLPIEDTQGFYNKAKRRFDAADNRLTQFVQDHPRSSTATGAALGAMTGAALGTDFVDTFNRIRRKG